jgi:hypothetical protein
MKDQALGRDQITVDLQKVREAIERIRVRPAEEAHTSEIIREYMGGFLINRGVPVHLSWNAQFGHLLKKHAVALEITELKPDQPVKDDLGHETSCSLWAL